MKVHARSATLLSAVLALCLASNATSVRAQHDAPDEQAAAAVTLPESVQELFDETAADGAPIVGTELQAYFASLPTHAHALFADAIDAGMIFGAEHARDLLSLRLDPGKIELVLTDNCILCHTATDMQGEETLMQVDPAAESGLSHLSMSDFLSDVHFRRGLSCSGCHGGTPADTDMADAIYERWPAADVRRTDRTWIPQFCGNCHADPSTMQRFNPSLPTDQVAKYETSRHGELLRQGDSKVAQCVSCHGIHGIRAADSRRSMVHPQAIPSTCGQCHSDAEYMAGYRNDDGTPFPTNQEQQYTASVHGIALLERGDLGAPACNDCHGNHAARPPEVAFVSQVCRTCHAQNGSLFDGSGHKQAFAENGWPECETCHGKHDITRADDAMLGTQPGELCYDCHTQYAPQNTSCIETADFFRETIVELASQYEHFEEQSEFLAERGLDAEALDVSKDELHDIVRRARSAIHAFDRSDFDQVAAEGRTAVAAGVATIDAQMGEYGFRRTGLVISIGVLSFLALMLWLKIRQIERKD